MRCAFFDWRDEVQKKSKKQDIELAALLFLVGLLLFIYPVVNQVSSYHTDEEEYEDLAMQFIQPEASPAPILPIPEKTVWKHSSYRITYQKQNRRKVTRRRWWKHPPKLKPCQCRL